MDDLLRDFQTETNDSLEIMDVELVRFEQDPNNAKIRTTLSGLSTPSRALAAFSDCHGSKRSRMRPRS
jgi:hypothetical protein